MRTVTRTIRVPNEATFTIRSHWRERWIEIETTSLGAMVSAREARRVARALLEAADRAEGKR